MLLQACSLLSIKEQTEIIHDAGEIRGSVIVSSNQKGPLRILRFIDDDGVPVLKTHTSVDKNGQFKFTVLPGVHYVAAFIDVNKDGSYQEGEHGKIYGVASGITVLPNQIVELEPLDVRGVPESIKRQKPVDGRPAFWKNQGRVVSLEFDKFNRDYYNLGLWKPLDFLGVAEGGLFFLEEYSSKKMPVIFIHGVMGGPTDFKTMVTSLDRSKFQPWMAYYPSGMRLDVISDSLVELITRLQHKYEFEKFCLVAHSMGGLVTRSLVMKYVEKEPGNLDRLAMMMTINSPMGGMTSAASGVKHSPIIVPSWLDVVPNSSFLNKIHDWNLPDQVEYHLVVSYIDDEGGDGVVPLKSQALPNLQAEAKRVYIYNSSHVGILSDKAFLADFNSILLQQLQD